MEKDLQDPRVIKYLKRPSYGKRLRDEKQLIINLPESMFIGSIDNYQSNIEPIKITTRRYNFDFLKRYNILGKYPYFTDREMPPEKLNDLLIISWFCTLQETREVLHYFEY